MKLHYLIQIITSFLGSMGFAILFGIFDKRLLLISFGGAAGWAICILVQIFSGSLFVSLLAGTAAVALFSEKMARQLATPATLLLVPMLIPMIPGGDLYYTMYYLFVKEEELLRVTAEKLLGEAGAIALGILVTTYLVRLIYYRTER